MLSRTSKTTILHPMCKIISTLFIEEMLRGIPKKFTILKFNMFNNINDSLKHLVQIPHMMILAHDNNCLLCKVFPLSLYGPTFLWFANSYPPLLLALKAWMGYVGNPQIIPFLVLNYSGCMLLVLGLSRYNGKS